MNKKIELSQDDLLDVQEKVQKILAFMDDEFEDMPFNLVYSIFVSSMVTFLMSYCDTLDEIKVVKKLFDGLLLSAISSERKKREM